MNTAFICVMSLAGLGLILGLAPILLYKSVSKCHEIITYYCGPKGEDWEANRTASYSKECKKRHDWIKGDFDAMIGRLCAAKFDFMRTCEYLIEIYQKYIETMQKDLKCLGEVYNCDDFMKRNCVKQLDDEPYLKGMFRDYYLYTEECKKKILEARRVYLKTQGESCQENVDFGKACFRLIEAMKCFWRDLNAVCKPKNSGTKAN